MATPTPVCGICELRHISKASVIWCSECEEGFCNDCNEHHSLAKATRNHITTPISEYQKVPTNVMKISQFCSKHNEKFQIYCKKHACTCCHRCVVETHNNCQDISTLVDVLQDIKTSNAFHEIEQKLTEVAENIQRIRLDRERNLMTLKEQSKMIESEINQTRQKINQYLDKIQEDLMNELATTEEVVTQKIQTLLTSLEQKEKEVNEFQANLTSIKQHASKLQVFLSMKEMEKRLENSDNFIDSLKDKDCLNRTTFSCQLEKILQSISSSNIQRFGELRVETEVTDLAIVRKKNKEAQILVNNLLPRTTGNMCLELKQIIDTGLSYTTSCLLLPDGKLAFANFGNCIAFFNADGSLDFKVDSKPFAFDIAYIEESNALAVTSGDGSISPIIVIDINKREIQKQIEVGTTADGIVVRNKTLLYCARKKGIRMVNMLNDSVTQIIKGQKSYWAFLASFGDRLYYTHKGQNTVTCCDLKGNKQWEFDNENVLRQPYGTSVDRDGNVYVVGQTTQNVVVISPDGLQHRQLLSAKDGLIMPIALYYDRSTDYLLVANKEDKAFLYKVN